MSNRLIDLVQRVVTRLSMVPGISVQVYSENRIAEMIQHKFTTVRDELWWDDFMDYATLTQGSDGRPNEHVVRELSAVPLGDEIVINQYKDVQYAWSPRSPYPLKSMPRRGNPAGLFVQGRTCYRLADAEKVIRFAPFTAGMAMLIRYRRHYAPFLPNDVVPMDDQLLILGAAYDYLEDDGTNPGQIAKFLSMYNDRLSQLKSQENDDEIPLSAVPYYGSNGWQTNGWQTVT